MISEKLTIRNEKGLHARASALFAETSEKFEASVNVEKDGISVCGKSIMGLLMLAAAKGEGISVTVDGSDEAALISALRDLVQKNFDEPS